jgi:hypothetical protein
VHERNVVVRRIAYDLALAKLASQTRVIHTRIGGEICEKGENSTC